MTALGCILAAPAEVVDAGVSQPQELNQTAQGLLAASSSQGRMAIPCECPLAEGLSLPDC